MYLKLLLGDLNFEFSFQERTLSCYIFYRRKTLINYERHFPKYFKCTMCGDKTEFDGDKLRLCEEHYGEFMERIRKKLQ